MLIINTTECFQISIMDGGIPIPMAGDDIDVGCVELVGLEVELDGSKSLVPEGGIFSYNWAAINGGQIKPFDENKEKPTVISLGTYILTVINSSNNCFASDTIDVFDTPAPFIKIEAADVLGCTNSSVQLDAEASEIRADNIHFWTTDIGEFCVRQYPFKTYHRPRRHLYFYHKGYLKWLYGFKRCFCI